MTKQLKVQFHSIQQEDSGSGFSYSSHSESEDLSSDYQNEETAMSISDTFLSHISQSYKVPGKFREKQPFHNILTYLTNIFRLNEYEIVGLATQIDAANWDFRKDLKISDRCLKDTNITLDAKLDREGKTLFVYLLFMAYFVKEGLNDKEEMLAMTADCETLYSRFKSDYNSWIEKYAPKLSVISINKKWKQLRDPKFDPQARTDGSVDYNNRVNNIVQLTGYHSSKNDFNDLMELGKCVKDAMNTSKTPNNKPILKPVLKPVPKRDVIPRLEPAEGQRVIPTDGPKLVPTDGPRLFPSDFDLLLANHQSIMMNSKALETIFVSREASKEPNTAAADRMMIMFTYNKPQEVERIDSSALAFAGNTLDELSRLLRNEELNAQPCKKVKKQDYNKQDSNKGPMSEEEARLSSLNMFAKNFSQFDLYDLGNLENKRSLGGEGVGFGRVFSRNIV